ncbi:hypothetical protein B0H19DRAFT_1264681 [Mycena capillaripes]|nr:hypothetical protein B0H19DRAFT_1264681 [Mycena capillaripes]
MDEYRPAEPHIANELTDGKHGSPPAQYTSAFFSHSKRFTVTGGNFTMIHQPAPKYPPNFRVIPMGDLDLLYEIRHKAGSTVARRRTRSSGRKVYATRIYGSNACMTAVVYQGDAAEEQWRKELARYSELRHPNLLQIYGISSTGRVHAAIFHDDLVPYNDLLEEYNQSHFSTVFFWACLDAQLHDAKQYISSVCGIEPHWSDYTSWIRPSKGVLSIELTPPEAWITALVIPRGDVRPFPTSLLTLPPTSEIIASIPLIHYHNICYWHLYRVRSFTIPPNMPIKLGSVRHFSGGTYESSIEVAFSPDFRMIDDGWLTEDPNIQDYWKSITLEEGTSVLGNGWIRVNSACVAEKYRRRVYSNDVCSEGWLAQACHTFNSLDIKSSLEDYFLVYAINCCLQLLGPVENLPHGYLFLCPWRDFETDIPVCFAIPEYPGYWSVDPSGVNRLSAQESKDHGFPDISVSVKVCGSSWDSSVYTGICQFQEGKGFDSYSQEVAIELDCPLFQISCEPEDLCAYLREVETDHDCPTPDGVSGNEDLPELGDEDYEAAGDYHSVSEGVMGAGNEDAHPTTCDDASADVNVIFLSNRINEAEFFSPSPSWSILIYIQLGLITLLFGFSLYDQF